MRAAAATVGRFVAVSPPTTCTQLEIRTQQANILRLAGVKLDPNTHFTDGEPMQH